ncbi:MAG: hypothetical protein HY591_02945 [Candidatus Omnitrophica bacterium]|nr:hypothetical protein [Candidatus Omnitrophota bacterium]
MIKPLAVRLAINQKYVNYISLLAQARILHLDFPDMSPEAQKLLELFREQWIIDANNKLIDAAMVNKPAIQEALADQASVAARTQGGIDFNRARINRRKEGPGVVMTFDQSMIARIKRDGFDGLDFRINTIVPLPIMDLRLLLGLKPQEEERQKFEGV